VFSAPEIEADPAVESDAEDEGSIAAWLYSSASSTWAQGTELLQAMRGGLDEADVALPPEEGAPAPHEEAQPASSTSSQEEPSAVPQTTPSIAEEATAAKPWLGIADGSDGNEPTDGTVQRSRNSESKNCYNQAPPTAFPVRGKAYLRDKKKCKGKDSMFELVGCDMFETEEVHKHVALLEGSVFQRMRRNAARAGVECPRVLIVNWMTPGIGGDLISHVQYYAEKPFTPVTEDDVMYKRMVDHFMTTDNDKFRIGRLKLIPQVQVGPWVVKKAVGQPALVCKALDTYCHVGEGYCEIAIDVGSSKVAQKVMGVCTSFAKSLVIDLGYTIEGKKEEELPERVLGAIRLHYIDLTRLGPLPPK